MSIVSVISPEVSVLFSEPKIPQSTVGDYVTYISFEFQCSSASRKFLKRLDCGLDKLRGGFQCSSASRKFLNYAGCLSARRSLSRVSVLFSEPKIPQSRGSRFWSAARQPAFQCSSASRKFLNDEKDNVIVFFLEVSVLFSEPKIPQSKGGNDDQDSEVRFSALQRAENSSIRDVIRMLKFFSGFSALQRAENSSNWYGRPSPARFEAFQCSSASRKFLNCMV